jgi:hypothetical protein
MADTATTAASVGVSVTKRVIRVRLARCDECAGQPRLKVQATRKTHRESKCPCCGRLYYVFEER